MDDCCYSYLSVYLPIDARFIRVVLFLNRVDDDESRGTIIEEKRDVDQESLPGERRRWSWESLRSSPQLYDCFPFHVRL